jgi:hypothetical protein
MKILFIAAALLLLAGCATVVPPSSQFLSSQTVTTADRQQAEAAWSRVLKQHVDDQGRVDFAAVSATRTDLDRFVSFIYAAAPNNRPDLFSGAQDILAFHINAYNALAMYNVIDSGIPASLAGLRKVHFFALKKVSVGAKLISLYDYENDVIRKLHDPRIHFALNCMVVACPRLPREPFVGARLNEQLDAATRLFFSEPRHIVVDQQRKVIRVSEILKFYTEDFLQQESSLARYIARYRELPGADAYEIEFIPYDWTVNVLSLSSTSTNTNASLPELTMLCSTPSGRVYVCPNCNRFSTLPFAVSARSVPAVRQTTT